MGEQKEEHMGRPEFLSWACHLKHSCQTKQTGVLRVLAVGRDGEHCLQLAAVRLAVWLSPLRPEPEVSPWPPSWPRKELAGSREGKKIGINGVRGQTWQRLHTPHEPQGNSTKSMLRTHATWNCALCFSASTHVARFSSNAVQSPVPEC